MRTITIGIVISILICGCATHRKTEAEIPILIPQTCTEPMEAFYLTYVVKKGDTLFSIARKFKDRDTLRHIVMVNDIKNPNLIYVGQIIYIE